MRPGIPATATISQIEDQFRARAQLRLPELYREYQEDTTPESEAQLALYTREVGQLLIPRYAKLASAQNQLERTANRGALYNRLSYAALFFALGLFIVWAPFIPIWEKWVPFALALVAPLVSPWLPDLYQGLRKRQHDLNVGLLLVDLDEAGKSLPLPPLSSHALPAAATSSAAAREGASNGAERTAADGPAAARKDTNGNAV